MAVFLSFLAGVVLFHLFNYFPFTAGFVFLLSLTLLFFKKKHILIIVAVVGMLYAFLRYSPETDFSHIRGKELFISGTFVSEAIRTPQEQFVQTFYTDSAAFTATKEPLNGSEGKDMNIISNTDFEIGGRYELTVKVNRDMTRLSPGVLNNNNLYANLVEVRDYKKGEKTVQAIFENARAEIDRYTAKNFDPDPGALISSITTGQRGYMSEELKKAFNSTGLAHILSISGTHFALFSVFLFGIFRFLIKYLPYKILQRVTLYITPSQGAAVLCIPFMMAYLAFSGWSIPAVRSFIMISLFLAGLLIGRKGFWLNSLLFAAFVIVLWSPDAIFSLSFQLSFLAVLFIGFSVGYMKDRESAEVGKNGSTEDKNFLSRFLTSTFHIFRTSILISLAASLGTAPLVAYHFHYFSIISPLANLFITPLIGFVLLPLSLMSSFVFLFTGNYLFAPLVKITADLIVYLVISAARFPFADIKISAFPAITVLFFYSGVAVYFVFVRMKNLYQADIAGENNKVIAGDEVPAQSHLSGSVSKETGLLRLARNDKTGYSLALMVVSLSLMVYLISSVLSRKHGISVTYLDVGQGDSAVVELPDNKVLVVDTGRSGREAAAFLKYRGIRTIDVIALSHSHPDHSAGAAYLSKQFNVKELWDNGRLIYPAGDSQEQGEIFKRAEHKALERGDVTVSKGYEICALHPYKEFYTMSGSDYNEENNSSLVLRIKGKSKSFLFAGDIEEEAEEDISHLGKWLKSDVIKVPHHGGKTSVSEAFFDAVSPEIAVISAGRDNSFGHPHRETLNMLGEVMSNPPIPPLAKGGEGGFIAAGRIFRTDIDGAIKITEKEGKLEIKTFKDFQIEKTKSFSGEIRNIKRMFEVW